MTSSSASPTVLRRLGGLWYFVVIIASLGLFAVVPFVHVATRLRRRSVWAWVAVYAVVDAVILYFMPQGKTVAAAPIQGILALVAIATAIAACAQIAPLRREAYGLPSKVRPGPAPDPAVAQVLAARARREEARKLISADPLMARELHIGRPDLPRAYDDGGLVDLATAPAPLIADTCGLTTEEANRLIALRGTFTTTDDAIVLADLPVTSWDRIRDRGVVIVA
ncbi:hypothetical protein [Actinokineospora globicatena]|uniref:Helix-hairpin-helix motif-containing protein n=1 Tax=Actinokineospora globicatena TaxID=103729 RepID=A0A9W6QL35_9PSEU|nr:hypothetical protein [Actinokineospora globicatena]GLW90474.1 hypothetical protein Aglo03_12900 [Actinokineospora globicatena]